MRGTPDLGDYDVLLQLASGGMCSVQLARHRAAGGMERLVVVKRMHPHLAGLREHAEMFLDEARLASQIRHPHVVAVEDVVDAGGELFLVQPYVESVALSALLAGAAQAGERIPPALVARILADTLAGLDGAHHSRDLRGEALAIVHRDVSPQNILVGTDGRSRVIDFGIATAARRITVTRDGALKGKVHYMAPEQLRRQPLDARADVFAAGVVLYEALTGARPFEGDDEADTLLGILIGDPTPASERVAGLPEALDAVLAKALEVDRGARWAGAAELLEALERALPPAPPRDVASLVERLSGEHLAAIRAQVRTRLDAAAEKPAPAASPAATPAPTKRTRRNGILYVSGVLLVAATLTAAVTAFTRRDVGAGPSEAIAGTAQGAVLSPAPPAATEPAAEVLPAPSAPRALSASVPSRPGAPRPTAAPRAAPSSDLNTNSKPSSSEASGPALHPNPYSEPR